jgi:hypothetical protein
VDAPRDISAELRQLRGKSSVTVVLMRNQKEVTVTVPIDQPSGSRSIARMASIC